MTRTEQTDPRSFAELVAAEPMSARAGDELHHRQRAEISRIIDATGALDVSELLGASGTAHLGLLIREARTATDLGLWGDAQERIEEATRILAADAEAGYATVDAHLDDLEA